MAGQVKFCRSCGKQIDANAKFCRYCGFRFETDGKEPRAQAPAQERKPDMRDKWKQSFEAGKARGRAFANKRAAVMSTSPSKQMMFLPERVSDVRVTVFRNPYSAEGR